MEQWRHVRKTVLYMLVGAIVSLLITYFNEGSQLSAMNSDVVSNSLFIGAFMGLFITNSPCAKGKC
jgi:RsiW-degrading membrane proteinase PrsW (M82 family)